MKHRTETEILEDFLKVTGGTVVRPTLEDEEELRSLEEMKERSGRDSQRSKELNAARRKELDILRLARGEVSRATV